MGKYGGYIIFSVVFGCSEQLCSKNFHSYKNTLSWSFGEEKLGIVSSFSVCAHWYFWYYLVLQQQVWYI